MSLSCFRYLVLLFAFLPVNACLLHAQNFDLDFHQIPLESVLNDLSDRYGLSFAYEDAQVEDLQVNVAFRGNSLHALLTKLLENTPLEFEIVRDKHILLVKKKLTSIPQDIRPRYTCRIIDAETGMPLSYATLVGTSSRKGALAGQDGIVKIEDHFSHKDSLLISHVGYESRIYSINQFRERMQGLKENEQLLVALRPRPSSLENVLITDQITVMDVHPSDDKITIRPSGVRTLPGWGEPDIYQMMGLLPGINSSAGISGGINIKGGTADQNLVLWDGIPIYHLSHFFGLFAPFNPYAVNKLDLYANGFGASKGGRVSSVIDIQSEPDSIDDLRIGLGANLLHTYAFLEIPHLNDKASLFISGRRAFSDIVASTTYNKWFNYTFQEGREDILGQPARDNGASLNLIPQFYYQDITAKWLYHPTSQDELSVSFYRGNDKLEYLQVENLPDRFSDNISIEALDVLKQSNWGISSRWKHRWNPKHQSEASLVYSDYAKVWSFVFVEKWPGFKYHREVHQHNNFQDFTLTFHHTWDLLPRYKMDLGAQWTQQVASLNYQEIFLKEESDVDTTQSLIGPTNDDFEGFISSFYVENHLNPVDNLQINAGLRFSQVAIKEKSYLEPRLSMSYAPHPDWSFRFRWGEYRQFAHQVFFENELRVGENFWILNTRPDQPDLKTSQLSLGLHYESDHFSFTADAYHRDFQGLLGNSFEYNREVRDLEDLDVYRTYLQYHNDSAFVSGNGRARGIDLWFQLEWKPYKTWLAYSLSEVVYQFDGFNLDQPFPAPHDQRHTLKWTHFLSFNDWSISANWLFHTGNPFSSVELERVEEAIGTTSNNQGQPPAEVVYVLDVPEYNGQRFSHYHRLDISVGKSFVWGDKGQWNGKIGLSVYNVYNRINVQRKRYIPMQQMQGGLDIMEANHVDPGLTPNIFFQISW